VRVATAVTIVFAALLGGCGSSLHESYLGPRVALGHRLSLASDLIYPAQLRSNDKVTGRFIVTANSLMFESSANQSASQQWPLRDVRAIHRPNPHELVIEPYAGSGYMLEIAGSGLVDRDYRIVVGRLALAQRLR
jgi:hypothetical protein